ncbi:MAG: glycosyltransferase family 39 protein [Alphaproteobacteria bacterium]
MAKAGSRSRHDSTPPPSEEPAEDARVAWPSRLPEARIALALVAAGALLRILLCWWTPPSVSFDDHFQPIHLMLQGGGVLPRKDACSMCQHPPVFYWTGGQIVRALLGAGISPPSIPKILQLWSCGFHVLVLPVLWLGLRRVPGLSATARLVALAVASFLPRGIYMAAMFSNDGLSWLCVAVGAWLLLRLLDRGLRPADAAWLGLAAAIAVDVKYTCYVLLPAIVAALAWRLFAAAPGERRRVLVAGAIALVPPALVLALYVGQNLAIYGAPLPYRDIDYGAVQPRDPGGLRWLHFDPRPFFHDPILLPGRLQSFWTLLWSSAWFDTEPKFLDFTEPDTAWWHRYFDWVRGSPFPAEPVPISGATRALATGLLGCGLAWLGFLLVGLGVLLRRLAAALAQGRAGAVDAAKLLSLPVMLATNLVMIALLARIVPFFSTLKASYVMNSLPALLAATAYGVDLAGRARAGRVLAAAALAILTVLSTVHTLRIVTALASGATG